MGIFAFFFEHLKGGNGEDGSFPGTRLRLGNDVSSPQNGSYGTLLDGGWTFESMCVYSTQEGWFEVEVVKGLGGGCVRDWGVGGGGL